MSFVMPQLNLQSPSGKSISLNVTETSLVIGHSEGKHPLEVPLRQVLSANYNEGSKSFEVAYLLHLAKKSGLTLTRIEGTVTDMQSAELVSWRESLMQRLYEDAGISRCRRVRVLVNPFGGVRKAVSIFQRIVEPILRSAGCRLDVTHTTHSGHASEIAKDLPLEYDVIVTVSGDGLIHEVMDGFGLREDCRRAFSIPIAPIPAGSGNGLSLNLLGIKEGFDCATAALNIVKGKPMKIDLFSFVQKGKRTISFMSQSMGLMADLDIGTDNIRWMGDTRFFMGFLRGVMQNKSCPVRLSIKVAESDKQVMATELHIHRAAAQEGSSPNDSSGDEHLSEGLPPLQHQFSQQDGSWVTLNEPLLYIYAGKGPYVGRDMMAFPVSLPNDGLIDVSAMGMCSRTDLLAAIGGAEKGDPFWHPKNYYYKALAYHVKPLAEKGNLAIDGEAFPFEEFTVEVHKEFGTLLSPFGHYAAEFSPDPPKPRGKKSQTATPASK